MACLPPPPPLACSVPFPIAAYGITKTALVAAAKALSQELGPEGIR